MFNWCIGLVSWHDGNRLVSFACATPQEVQEYLDIARDDGTTGRFTAFVPDYARTVEGSINKSHLDTEYIH